MISKKNSSQSDSTLSSLSPQDSIRLIERQHQKGLEILANRPINRGSLDAWENTTREFLIRAFGTSSNNIANFINIGENDAFLITWDEAYWENQRKSVLLRKLEMLKSCIEQLEVQVEVTQFPISKGNKIIENIELICYRFHIVGRQLRIRHDNRHTIEANDEYDVQDLLHALLCIFFEDIRSEEWTPSYAGKSSRMDFLLKEERVVIEVKKARKGLGSKELGSQLIEDIARYKSHPECDVLVCFVYDPEGIITNPRGIERDLSREEESMKVKVIIAPKGY
jgi:hypothetical protein